MSQEAIAELELKKHQFERNIGEIDRQLAKLRGADESVRAVSIGDFLAENTGPVRWIIDGFLPKGATGVIAADGGVGKTTLMVQLTLCIAAGRKVFRFNTSQSRVLYIIAEGARPLFRERVRSAMRALNIPNSVDWSIQPPDFFEFAADGRQFQDLVESSRADLVVLDTLGYFFHGDENSSQEWKAKLMGPLRKISQRYGTAFFLVHHQGKGLTKKGRGSSAIYDDADLFLRLEAREPDESNVDPPERWLYVDKNKYGPSRTYKSLTYDAVNAVFRSV